MSSFLKRTWCESTLLLRDFHSNEELSALQKQLCGGISSILGDASFAKSTLNGLQTSEALKRECLSTLSSDRRGRRRCKFHRMAGPQTSCVHGLQSEPESHQKPQSHDAHFLNPESSEVPAPPETDLPKEKLFPTHEVQVSCFFDRLLSLSLWRA